MKKLYVSEDPIHVARILDRLEEASIAAHVVTEKSILQIELGGAAPQSIFIDDDADAERALAIIQETAAAWTEHRCPRCDYDLAGHRGRTTCPECSLPVSVTNSNDWICKTCGEKVPETFEVCWNCPPSEDSDDGSHKP